MDVALGEGTEGGGQAGEDELRFVVGNACSRLINLLMDSGADRALVAEEAAFLSEQAALLAASLDRPDTAGS